MVVGSEQNPGCIFTLFLSYFPPLTSLFVPLSLSYRWRVFPKGRNGGVILSMKTLFFSEWELQIEREKIMNDTIAACFNVRVWGEDRWREGRG